MEIKRIVEREITQKSPKKIAEEDTKTNAKDKTFSNAVKDEDEYHFLTLKEIIKKVRKETGAGIVVHSEGDNDQYTIVGFYKNRSDLRLIESKLETAFKRHTDHFHSIFKELLDSKIDKDDCILRLAQKTSITDVEDTVYNFRNDFK